MQSDRYLLAAGIVCALAAAAWDLLRGRIPNQLTYGAIILGLAVRAYVGGWRGTLDGFLGGLLGGGIFLIFFLVRGMGAGDVKLMTAVGCLAGVQQLLVIMLVSALAGGVLALGYMFFHRRGARTVRNLGALLRYHLAFGLRPHPEISLQNPEVIRIPYAVAIAAGTLYAFGAMLLRG